jgi:hypothetical protein
MGYHFRLEHLRYANNPDPCHVKVRARAGGWFNGVTRLPL